MDDQQLEMQKLRLLDDDGPEPAVRVQPLALRGPRQSGKVKRSALTPVRFCIGLCSLVGLLVIGCICYGIFSFIRSLGRPHEAHHADVKLVGELGRESELVRPFFGPPASGSKFASFDLGLLVHARWDVEIDSVSAAVTEETDDKIVRYTPRNESLSPDIWKSVHDESGLVSMRPFVTVPWREIHREVVLRDIPLDTQPVRTTVPLSFPREIIRSLVNQSAGAEVVASFFMLPPSAWKSPLSSLDEAQSAKIESISVRWNNTNLPSRERPPPIWSRSDADEQDSPLADFLSRAAAFDSLLHPRGRIVDMDSGSQTYDIRSRVWITVPNDYALYNATSFRQAMAEKKEYLRGACKGGLDRQSPTCWSTFSTFGHFEHLLQVDGSTAAGVRQWYAPSLIADLGDASAKDYIPLPSLHGNVSSTDATAADQDFAFAYRIAFSISSVRKLSFLQNMHKSIRIETSKLTADRQNMTAYDQAWNHDSTEFWNALRGHTFEPGTRPVARGVLEFISGLLDFLAPAVQLYFFLTRSLTTGLSLPALVLDHTNSFFWVVHGGVRFYIKGDGPLFIVLFVLGFNFLLAGAVANLVLRLNWSWGGPLRWVPVGVSRRRPTHSERASARADAKLIWRDRLIFLAVCVLGFAYGPSTPKLIAASPPTPPPTESSSALRVTEKTSLIGRTLIPLIGPWFSAIWWLCSLSQLHLNFRRKSFGESKLYHVMALAEAVLDWTPIVFHGVLGRAELMESLTLRGVVKMSARVAMVYQAWLYPSNPQEEAEDE